MADRYLKRQRGTQCTYVGLHHLYTRMQDFYEHFKHFVPSFNLSTVNVKFSASIFKLLPNCDGLFKHA